MTIGQRIARKRKDLDLSQEALGADDGNGELTAAQLKMVEEIVDRYIKKAVAKQVFRKFCSKKVIPDCCYDNPG